MLPSLALWGSLEHSMGMVIVMVTLTILWVVTAAVGTAFRRRLDSIQKTVEATHAALTAKPAAPAAMPGVSALPGVAATEEEMAAIVAVLSILCGERHRIVAIAPVSADWSREGRRQHHSSHRLR